MQALSKTASSPQQPKNKFPSQRTGRTKNRPVVQLHNLHGYERRHETGNQTSHHTREDRERNTLRSCGGTCEEGEVGSRIEVESEGWSRDIECNMVEDFSASLARQWRWRVGFILDEKSAKSHLYGNVLETHILHFEVSISGILILLRLVPKL